MKDPVSSAILTVRNAIEKACGQAIANGTLPAFDTFPYTVEIPSDTNHGDFACNIALVGAKTFKKSPRMIAQAICENVTTGGILDKVEIAGPGFINFSLTETYYTESVLEELANESWTGRLSDGESKKVMVEFVSANPTGPMHLGNARGGALGDTLASVLDACGYQVTREFYVNDAGNQVELFGVSLEARYLQIYCDNIEFPENGYHGDDITTRAREFSQEYGDTYIKETSEKRRKAMIDYALPRNIAELRATLEQYRVFYDVWFPESSLHENGSIEKVIDILRKGGHTYDQDGALWYKATAFGSDKDEVLIKQNGYYTYFAVDIAYHYNKFADRGFSRVINVWGADHHGHVARMKGAMNALGIGGDNLDIVLMQLVDLMQDGDKVRMSKRTGKAITLSDLLEVVPVDAARFYFNLREYQSHFTFDLDLALKQSSDNPVYYVQYAHARICSILKHFDTTSEQEISNGARALLLSQPDELALIRKLAFFPSVLLRVVSENEPSHITRYSMELAGLFHRFYTNCRVRTDQRDLSLSRAALCLSVRQVLSRCLGLLKIQAPEIM